MKNVLTVPGVPVVALYLRVSTHEQAMSGYSLRDQEIQCRSYLERVYGPGKCIVKVFADEGISGKLGFARPGSSPKNVRPALSALVSEISDGRVSAVAFWRLDRLSRNARVWLELLHDFVLKYDIQLISVQEGIDPKSPIGRYVAASLAISAELFADIGGENVKASMRRRREDGYPTGQIGYGWRRTRKETGDG